MTKKNIKYNAICIAITIFLSAFLLFLIQPMIGKIILPKLGGSPEVWNSCMMFYQCLLFLGYVYAHLITKLSIKYQKFCHACVLICSLAMIPIGNMPELDTDNFHNPIFWLIPSLFISVGVPFFVVSTTSPLLQRWFSYGHISNPYFLYSLSNLGSFIALFSYPFIIEPNINLLTQTNIWSLSYAVLVLLLLLCAISTKKTENMKNENENAKPIKLLTKIKWLLLAFCPSSLMLGTTTYITTDIAPVPLLWIVPLALYLVSFIIVFGKYSKETHNKISNIFVFFAILALLTLSYNISNIYLTFLFFLVFFLAAMVCHGELAINKPAPANLTEFYLIMSFGGMLGGIFNSLIVPFAFNGLYELPLILAATIALVPGPFIKNSKPRTIAFDFLIPLGVFLILIIIHKSNTLDKNVFNNIVMIILGVAYGACARPVRLSLFVMVVILSNIVIFNLRTELYDPNNRLLYSERNFYGVKDVIRVTHNQNIYNILYHGSTVHGAQKVSDAKIPEPLTYYHKTGPLGNVFSMINHNANDWNIGVIGLGTGASACYKKGNQLWDFYEIDPLIIEIAKNDKIFSYLNKCAPDANIIVGDARIKLQDTKDNKYNLLIVDAFSSDAIPMHLMTKEAFDLYFNKIKKNGILMLHISNRYLNLSPVITNIANKKGYCVIKKDDTEENASSFKNASSWIVIAEKCDIVSGLFAIDGWVEQKQNPDYGYWSDDFHNILKSLKFFN